MIRLREAFLLIALAALGLGWWLDHSNLAHQVDLLRAELAEAWASHDRERNRRLDDVAELEATLQVEQQTSDEATTWPAPSSASAARVAP